MFSNGLKKHYLFNVVNYIITKEFSVAISLLDTYRDVLDNVRTLPHQDKLNIFANIESTNPELLIESHILEVFVNYNALYSIHYGSDNNYLNITYFLKSIHGIYENNYLWIKDKIYINKLFSSISNDELKLEFLGNMSDNSFIIPDSASDELLIKYVNDCKKGLYINCKDKITPYYYLNFMSHTNFKKSHSQFIKYIENNTEFVDMEGVNVSKMDNSLLLSNDNYDKSILIINFLDYNGAFNLFQHYHFYKVNNNVLTLYNELNYDIDKMEQYISITQQINQADPNIMTISKILFSMFHQPVDLINQVKQQQELVNNLSTIFINGHGLVRKNNHYIHGLKGDEFVNQLELEEFVSKIKNIDNNDHTNYFEEKLLPYLTKTSEILSNISHELGNKPMTYIITSCSSAFNIESLLNDLPNGAKILAFSEYRTVNNEVINIMGTVYAGNGYAQNILNNMNFKVENILQHQVAYINNFAKYHLSPTYAEKNQYGVIKSYNCIDGLTKYQNSQNIDINPEDISKFVKIYCEFDNNQDSCKINTLRDIENFVAAPADNDIFKYLASQDTISLRNPIILSFGCMLAHSDLDVELGGENSQNIEL